MDKGVILAIACLVGTVAIWAVGLFSVIARAPLTRPTGNAHPEEPEANQPTDASAAVNAAWRRTGTRHLRVWGLTLIPVGVIAILFVTRAPGIVAGVEGLLAFASFAWLVVALRDEADAVARQRTDDEGPGAPH